MRKQRDLMLPMLRAQSPVIPETLNAETRTVEVVFYSGASVQRIPYFDDPYELTFSLDPKAVRMERFNKGAPLVDNHQAYGSVGEVVLGVIEKAWLTKDDGRAKVRFSTREGVDAIFKDVQDGILCNFSMGAVIHQMRDITEKGDAQRRLLAIDWEPCELSIVPVNADAGAQALATADKFPCKINFSAAADADAHRGKAMKVRLLADVEELGKVNAIVEIEDGDFDEKLHSKDLTIPSQNNPKSARRIVDDKIEADKAFGVEVKKLAVAYNLDEVWVQRHLKLGTPIEQIIIDATERRAKLAPAIDGTIEMGDDHDSIGWKSDRMVEALAARTLRKAPPEPARQYAQHSLAEMALECLGWAGRARGRNLDARRRPDQVIELALHTQSDFPLLLANILNKVLLPAYEQAPQTFRRIAAQKTFNDFRAHRFIRAGDFPVPLQVNEHGEFKSGTMSEGSESVTAVTYGRILGLSRQLLINDDLGGLADIAGNAGRRIADFENATFFAVCIAPSSGTGPALADGQVVYHSTHANLTAGGALSNTLLGSALALMMAQTSLDGLKLNVMPTMVLTAPVSYVLAKTLLAAITPTQASNVNPFAGDMVAIADANLSGTRWYALADPGRLPNYIYGYLAGQAGPRTEVQNGFRVDGVEVKVAIDFGCGAIEYRGGVSGAGV